MGSAHTANKNDIFRNSMPQAWAKSLKYSLQNIGFNLRYHVEFVSAVRLHLPWRRWDRARCTLHAQNWNFSTSSPFRIRNIFHVPKVYNSARWRSRAQRKKSLSHIMEANFRSLWKKGAGRKFPQLSPNPNLRDYFNKCGIENSLRPARWRVINKIQASVRKNFGYRFEKYGAIV